MARYEKMTSWEISQRESDMKELRVMLNDDRNEGICIALSRKTGKAYSTIRQIKSGNANPHCNTVEALLIAAKELYPI